MAAPVQRRPAAASGLALDQQFTDESGHSRLGIGVGPAMEEFSHPPGARGLEVREIAAQVFDGLRRAGIGCAARGFAAPWGRYSYTGFRILLAP